MRNICFISMGSNDPTAERINKAQDLLRKMYNDISFSGLQQTKPIDFASGRLFFNQVAKFTTTESSNSVMEGLKYIEKLLGRTPSDKQQGHVPIDLDLIIFNEHVLRTDDMKRSYILNGLKRLKRQ